MRLLSRIAVGMPAGMLILCLIIAGALVICQWAFVDQFDPDATPDKFTERFNSGDWSDSVNESSNMTIGNTSLLEYIGHWIGTIIGTVGEAVASVFPYFNYFTLNLSLLTNLGFIGQMVRVTLLMVIGIGAIDLLWIG